ncbi:hypothetical protein ACJX0J_039561, partial [Zea mays]
QAKLGSVKYLLASLIKTIIESGIDKKLLPQQLFERDNKNIIETIQCLLSLAERENGTRTLNNLGFFFYTILRKYLPLRVDEIFMAKKQNSKT